MPKLIFLGTSNAIPDEKHENTHMILVGEKRTVLIDCVNNPIVRLRQAKLDLFQITDLILTHFHPDHVSGVPSFLMNSWLLGRSAALNVYGLEHTLERIQKLMSAYDWETWPNFFPVNFYNISDEEMSPVLDAGEYCIFASPVHHMVPNIGLRIEFPGLDRVLAYSCDTEPCQAVVRLADGADILIHESTGPGMGHSSPLQAGEIARQAEVQSLYLIHYPTGGVDPAPFIEQAHTLFQGPVILAEDFMEINV